MEITIAATRNESKRERQFDAVGAHESLMLPLSQDSSSSSSRRGRPPPRGPPGVRRIPGRTRSWTSSSAPPPRRPQFFQLFDGGDRGAFLPVDDRRLKGHVSELQVGAEGPHDVAERREGGDGVGPAPRGRRAVDATGRQPAPSNSGLAWRISPTVSDPQTLDALDASPLDPGDS